MAVTLVHDCDIERRPSPQAKNGDFRDCSINSANPTTPQDAGIIPAGIIDAKSLYVYRGLFLYDLAAFIPASATITAAYWHFYVSATGALGTQNFRAVRCRRIFKEDEATYTVWQTGSNWGTAGALHLATDRDETVIDLIGPLITTGWFTKVLINIVGDAWTNQGGTCAFIWERYDQLGTVGDAHIYSKEQGVGNPERPHHLRVTYTLDGRTYQAFVH